MLLHFDYDGVLVDSFDQLLTAFQQTTVDTPDDFETIEDLSATGIATLLGVPESHIERYTERMHALLEADGYAPAMFPGIPDLLKTLSEQHTIVIVTSNYDHLVRRGLSQNGVAECVSLVLDARQPGTKSDKIRHALERFGCPPDESFMIGDTRGDIRHGKRARVRTAGVTWGYQTRETLEQESPDFMVDTPHELQQLLCNNE